MNAAMFQTEIQRIEKLLYRIARAYLNNEQDAEDAVQDALIRAWEKRDTLKDIRQFTPWMTRILSNRCKDMLRRSRKWSFFPLEEDTVLTEMPDLEMPVMEAMQHLKPALRLLITLYYVDGYSVQEISHMLGLPSGTVKTRMRSARRQLSRTLRMDWEDEL